MRGEYKQIGERESASIFCKKPYIKKMFLDNTCTACYNQIEEPSMDRRQKEAEKCQIRKHFKLFQTFFKNRGTFSKISLLYK